MQLKLLVPLLTLALVGLAKGQATAGNEADAEVKKEILKLEEMHDQANLKGDTDFIERIYPDDISFTNGSGELLSKAQVIANLRSGKQKFISMKHDDIRLHVYGNTAITTGHSTSVYEYKGKNFSSPRRFTNVWVKQGGEWRLVVHHVTPAATQ